MAYKGETIFIRIEKDDVPISLVLGRDSNTKEISEALAKLYGNIYQWWYVDGEVFGGRGGHMYKDGIYRLDD